MRCVRRWSCRAIADPDAVDQARARLQPALRRGLRAARALRDHASSLSRSDGAAAARRRSAAGPVVGARRAGLEPAAARADRRSARSICRPRTPAIRTARRRSTRCDCSIASMSSSVSIDAGRGRPATRIEVRLRLHRRKPRCCEPYVLELARESIATFSRRYGFKPREPMTVELYPDHDDFAVRVAALPGIGLLGVTFGYLVAMDSPSGPRDRRVPLGQHAVARDGARVHAGSDRSSRAALAERRHLGVRGMAHRSDARRRRAARCDRGVAAKTSSCRSRSRFGLHPPAAIRTRCRSRTCRPA